LVQLAPTVLELAGVVPSAELAALWRTMQSVDAASEGAVSGVRPDSLGAALLSGGTIKASACYGESDHAYSLYGWAPLRSIRLADEKYIRAPQLEYYDLASDSGETNNLAALRPDRVAELERRLADMEDCFERRVAETVSLSELAWRKLASLGYAAGRRAQSPRYPDLAELENPATAIKAAGLMTELVRMIETGRRGARALAMAQQMVELAPRTATFHGLLAQLHEFRGEHEAAEAAYRQAIELDPDDARYFANLGIRLCVKGELEEGIELLQQAHKLDPENKAIADNLARAQQHRGEIGNR